MHVVTSAHPSLLELEVRRALLLELGHVWRNLVSQQLLRLLQLGVLLLHRLLGSNLRSARYFNEGNNQCHAMIPCLLGLEQTRACRLFNH